MGIAKKLKDYLDKEKVKYQVLHHPEAYSASRVADAQHVPGKEFVKAVIVKVDGKNIMCVLSADHLVDFDKLKKVVGASKVELAHESEIIKLFPGYEIGAEPPLGHLYGLKVYADKLLEGGENIVFNGGTHTDVVKMKFQDYLKLEKPVIATFVKHI